MRLHSRPLLNRLSKELYERFGANWTPIKIKLSKEEKEKIKAHTGQKRISSEISVWIPFDLPGIPERGDFDVREVRKSRYFFH